MTIKEMNQDEVSRFPMSNSKKWITDNIENMDPSLIRPTLKGAFKQPTNIHSKGNSATMSGIPRAKDGTQNVTLQPKESKGYQSNKMKANELRMDVIHAAELLHHICGRSCSCCSCR